MAGRSAVRFGDFEFDDAVRQITCAGAAVHLSPKAFDLLALLIRRRPEAVAKPELIDALWPDVHVDERNLKNLAYEIRTAFAAGGGSPKWIRTVHRFGYAFAAHVSDAQAAFLLDGTAVHRLKSGANSIGRGGDATPVLLHPGVSRHHATIRIAGGTATIEDAGSRNGTFVNEERITGTVELHDRDRVRFGPVGLIFRFVANDDTTDVQALTPRERFF